MFKNVATKIALFAFDTTSAAPKTGDAANISAYVSKDYGTVTQLTDTSATEMDATNAKGWYLFDVTATECNADALLFSGKSATANVSIVGQYIFTHPNRLSSMVIDAAGLVDANTVKVGPTGAGTAQTAGDIPARLPAALTANGNMKASMVEILTTALTETAGLLAGGFKKFFNIASPASTMDALTLVATATNLTNAPTAGDFTAAMKTSLNAATPAVTVSDKTGFSLSAAGIQAIWDRLTSALTTAGSIGKLLVDNIDAAISSRLPTASYVAPLNATATANAVWNEPLSGHLTGGTTGAALNAASSAGDPWATALPGAYGTGTAGKIVGTNLDALVSSRTKPADTQAAVTLVATTTNLTNAPTAGDFTAAMKTSLNAATPAVTVSDKTGFSLSAGSIQAIWDALTSALTTAGSIGKLLVDNINATISSRLPTSSYVAPLTATTTANAVWDATMSAHLNAGSTGEKLNGAGSGGSGADPWSTALPGAYAAGTAGNILGNNLDAKVSTRTKPADTQAAVTTVVNDVGITQAGADKVWASAARTLTSFGTLVSDTASAVWVAGTRTLTSYGTLAADTATATAAAVWSATPRTLTSFGTLAADTATAVWAAGTRTLTSFGTLVADTATAVWAASSRTLTSYGTLAIDGAAAVWSAAVRTLTAGTNIVLAKGTGVTGFNDLDASGVRAAVGLANANLDTQLAALDLDVVNGSNAILARTDVATSTRMAAGSYTAPDNSSIAAIKAKTDNLPAQPAAVSDIPTAAANADKMLGRSIAGYADGGRTVKDALRALRNKVSIVAGVMTVTMENDTTTAWTGSVTTTPGDPISSIDPT